MRRQQKKFPSGKHPAAKDKTAISKLRDSLCHLTGIGGDPFLAFNEAVLNDPNNPSALYNLGVMHYMAGRFPGVGHAARQGGAEQA